MTDVQKTYEVLKRIANDYPTKFIEEWNKGLDYTNLLVIRQVETCMIFHGT